MPEFEWDTDIGEIWRQVVAKYNAAQLPKYRISQSLSTSWHTEHMEEFSKQEFHDFSKWRNTSNTPLEKLRTKTKKWTGIAIAVIKAAGGAASSSFAPASAIAEVLEFLIQASRNVTDNKDKIEAVFDAMEALFLRLQLVERWLPKRRGFAEQLARVFARILDICGLARSYADSNTLELFAKELFGGTSEVAEAYTAFQTQMDRLDSAALMATLGIVSESRQHIEGIRTVMQDLRDESKESKESILGLKPQIDARFSDVFKELHGIGSQMRSFSRQKNRVSEHSISKREYNTEIHNPSAAANKIVLDNIRETDPGNRGSNSLESLKHYLSTRDTEALLNRRLDEMSLSYLSGTCHWIDVLVEDAIEDEKPLLITGEPHTGKSMMAAYIFRYLRTEYGEVKGKSVAYFRFSEEFGSCRSVKDMVNHCAVQIATQDQEYGKLAKGVVQTHSNRNGATRTLGENHALGWGQFFKEPFKKLEKDQEDTQRLLYLVLDGIDVLNEDDLVLFTGYMREVSDEAIQIRFILTATSTEKPLNLAVPEKNTVLLGTRNKADLRTFIESEVRASSRLSILKERYRNDLIDDVHKRATSKLALVDL
jgi:hypothetical protein